jgi:uncharacterized protein YggE
MPSLPPQKLRAAVAAALALFVIGQAQAQQPAALKDMVPNISAEGRASKEVVPDIAILSVGVDTERPKAADAAQDNASATQAIVNEIKAQGIEAKDIRTAAVTLQPVYDEAQAGATAKRTLRGYLAHNSLAVRVRDIAKAGVLAARLADRGANFFGGITFDYSQKDADYESLREEAARDAQRKANAYAGALGLRLGRVLEIAPEPRETVPPPVPRMMAAPAAQSVAIPVEPGAETLSATVRVTWELSQ